MSATETGMGERTEALLTFFGSHLIQNLNLPIDRMSLLLDVATPILQLGIALAIGLIAGGAFPPLLSSAPAKQALVF